MVKIGHSSCSDELPSRRSANSEAACLDHFRNPCLSMRSYLASPLRGPNQPSRCLGLLASAEVLVESETWILVKSEWTQLPAEPDNPPTDVRHVLVSRGATGHSGLCGFVSSSCTCCCCCCCCSNVGLANGPV